MDVWRERAYRPVNETVWVPDQYGWRTVCYWDGTQYVERQAAEMPVALDRADLPAAQVRQRVYVVGAAIARTLDRVRLDWREVLERSRDSTTPPLDSLLSDAVSTLQSAGLSIGTITEQTTPAVAAGTVI